MEQASGTFNGLSFLLAFLLNVTSYDSDCFSVDKEIGKSNFLFFISGLEGRPPIRSVRPGLSADFARLEQQDRGLVLHDGRAVRVPEKAATLPQESE